MCGIFGLITTEESNIRKKYFFTMVNHLFKLSESGGLL